MNTKEVQKKEASEVKKKRFKGEVVSNKMNKTIVVRVDSVKVHPKYQKRYTVSKKYKVHDEINRYKAGDKIEFVECRPISKDKKWRAIYQGQNDK
jgi:small subunit ribosomal protein S17